MRAAIRVLTVVCAVGVLTAGCGGNAKEDPTMTPDEASNELTAVSRAVMEVLSPGEPVDLREDGPPTPCGGPGGNEYTKIRYGVSLEPPTPPTGDATTLFTSVGDRLRELGYTVSDPDSMGGSTTMTFQGEAVGGGVTQRDDGTWTFGADTDCLDNPDRSEGGPSS